MSLYPALNDPLVDKFRLNEICEIKLRLVKERDYRISLYKKYNRSIKILTGVDASLIAASLGLGVSGSVLLSTVVATPVAIGAEAAAGVCGVLGVVSKLVNRKLLSKAKKHDEIRVLAESKLSTISDIISKALTDNKISDQEFNLILAEVEKYNAMKADIRTKVKKEIATISEAEKKELIQRGKHQAMSSIKGKLEEL